MWGTVEAGVEFIFAVAVEDSFPGARFDRFRSTNFQDTLPDHDVLLLRLGAGVLPAAISTDFVTLGAAPEAI